MNKKLMVLFSVFLLFILSACHKETVKEIVIPTCSYTFEEYYGDVIPIKDIHIENAKTIGNLENFINVCKDQTVNPIKVSDGSLRTYQIELSFENIYPLKDMVLTNYLSDDKSALKSIDIDFSLDGKGFKRVKEDLSLLNAGNKETVVSLNNESAQYVRIIFQSERGVGNYGGKEFGLNDVRFHLGDGLIVKKNLDWENALKRYDGWSGADGIFSFNLTNGKDNVGASANTTGFIFSDTFVGKVNPNNGVRQGSIMINNSLGYYDGNENIAEGMTFDYRTGLNNVPKSVFLPNDLIGYTANNLINGGGLNYYNTKDALLTNQAEGNMWLSESFNQESLTFDLEESFNLSKLYLWNYNEDPLKGIKDFELYYSNDDLNYTLLNSYTLSKASGNSEEPYTQSIDLSGIHARYLKINMQSTYEENPSQVGLGKVMIFDQNERYLFAKVSASSTDQDITGNEKSARLWLQDGVVIGNNFYLFPITVKDKESAFEVTDVSLIKVPIVNERLDYNNAVYMDSPLESKTPDGGIIYYGAGVLNYSASGGYDSGDGYVYIYGYKDLNGERNLVVARTLPQNIENFNAWEYYNGISWSKDINDSYGLKTGVSAELSVTYMESGQFKGKFMLVVMENTTSGKVSYSLSDTPYGSFSDYKLLYKTPESYTLNNAFTYNAKMHPHLSKPGNYLISYNVNGTTASSLKDVNVYRPRFINVVEVKHRDE